MHLYLPFHYHTFFHLDGWFLLCYLLHLWLRLWMLPLDMHRSLRQYRWCWGLQDGQSFTLFLLNDLIFLCQIRLQVRVVQHLVLRAELCIENSRLIMVHLNRIATRPRRPILCFRLSGGILIFSWRNFIFGFAHKEDFVKV